MLVNSLVNLSRSCDLTGVRDEDTSLVVLRDPTCLDTGLLTKTLAQSTKSGFERREGSHAIIRAYLGCNFQDIGPRTLTGSPHSPVIGQRS